MDHGKAHGEVRKFFIDGHAHDAPPLSPALYVVATPIGNLEDITLRALRTIASADVLAAEDTRHTRRLLDRYGIERRVVACHDHNEAGISSNLVSEIEAGRSIALVSDAGTPLVSDPGYRLATTAIEAGIAVVPVPGPSAPTAALVGSGLPSDTFTFAGFPPQKSAARRKRFEELATAPGTLLLFEAPHRLAASLVDLSEVLGDRNATVAREITKVHEEFRRGTLIELAKHYAANGARGEVVIAIAPGAEAAPDANAVLRDLLQTMPASRAAAEASRLVGRPKRELYALALAMKDGRG